MEKLLTKHFTPHNMIYEKDIAQFHHQHNLITWLFLWIPLNTGETKEVLLLPLCKRWPYPLNKSE